MTYFTSFFIFWTTSSQSGAFYIYSTSWLELATFQVLDSHGSVLENVLDVKEIAKERTRFYWTFYTCKLGLIVIAMNIHYG